MTNEPSTPPSLGEQRIAAIREKLQSVFSPTELRIEDQSHLHAGHAGAKSGKGHFDLTIVSEHFSGQTLIQRHRAIYAALGEMMDNDIHALSISALTPSET